MTYRPNVNFCKVSLAILRSIQTSIADMTLNPNPRPKRPPIDAEKVVQIMLTDPTNVTTMTYKWNRLCRSGRRYGNYSPSFLCKRRLKVQHFSCFKVTWYLVISKTGHQQYNRHILTPCILWTEPWSYCCSSWPLCDPPCVNRETIPPEKEPWTSRWSTKRRDTVISRKKIQNLVESQQFPIMLPLGSNRRSALDLRYRSGMILYCSYKSIHVKKSFPIVCTLSCTLHLSQADIVR